MKDKVIVLYRRTRAGAYRSGAFVYGSLAALRERFPEPRFQLVEDKRSPFYDFSYRDERKPQKGATTCKRCDDAPAIAEVRTDCLSLRACLNCALAAVELGLPVVME